MAGMVMALAGEYLATIGHHGILVVAALVLITLAGGIVHGGTTARKSAHTPARRWRAFVLVLAGATITAGSVPAAWAAGGLVAGGALGGPRLQVLVAEQGAAAGTQVTLTSKTIVVSPSVVKSSLTSISADGSTYTFSNGTGPLAQVAPGKVLLLEGQDALVVKTVKHDGSKLIVGVTPASLTDVVQAGQIAVSGPPDIAAATGIPLDTVGLSGAPVSPQIEFGAPAIGLRLGARPLSLSGSTNTFAYKGSVKGFTYKVGFTGKPDGLHATGEFCYQLVGSASGSSCGNGLSINVTLDGVFTWSNESLNIGVAGGAVRSGSFSLSGMSSQVKLNYAVLRGNESTVGASPPVLKIPFAFEAPLCGSPLGCGGLPLYSKFYLALLVKLGISGKNSTIQGGVNVTIGGSGTVSASRPGSVGGTVTGGQAKGSFTLGSALTPGASGVEVALQNKFGVGLGIRGINGLYYLSAITAVGETTGSLVAGESCKAYVGTFTITGNFEAQLFGFSVSSPAKTLFKKTASYKQPPC